MKYLLLLPLLLILSACNGEVNGEAEAAVTKSKFPVAPGWALTGDLTPQDGSVTTKILIDPQGQKFLIVGRSSGTAVIPYKEIEVVKDVEKK